MRPCSWGLASCLYVSFQLEYWEMEMKKSAFALVAGTTMALSTVAFGQVFSQSPALAINDDPTVSTVLAVAGGPVSISDLNVVFQVTHTFDGDLDVVLQGPTGFICLTTDNGGAGLDYITTRFDDAAATAVTAGAAPFNDNFRPEGALNGWIGVPATFTGTNFTSLSGFNGSDANGNWTLYIDDDAGGDVGTLTYWSLEFNGSVDSNGPAPITAPTNPTATAVATPNSGTAASTTLLTVTVTPGSNPTSTGITVTGDLSGIGGSATQAFFNDGSNGDVTAGDGIWSYNATVGAVAGGPVVLPVNIVDGQARTGTANINFFVSAAPSVFTDLGSVNCTGINQSFSIAAGEVKWFKMTIPAINDAPNYFADFWTNSTGTLADTEIGLYDNNGAIIDFDDDSGNGAKSMLTFGDTVNIRPDADGFDFDLDGFNGTLAGGTYWLAVGAFNTTYLTGWQATSTSAATGSVDLRANIADPSCITAPTNPTGVGSGGVVSGCGGNTLATVTVTGGLNPASTGITVSLDTTALGGGSVAMLDNGTGGDVTAGDNIFSATVAVGGGADAVFALPFTVSDAEARSSGGSLNVTRSGTEIGDLPATALKYYGVSGSTIAGAMTAGDADMYAICVNDTAAFDATTIGGGPAFDSQLFLFNADGTGALMSDDDLAVAGFSRINAAAAAEPDYDLVSGGLYYIAVSAYNKDPITSGVATDTIWANQNNLASFLGTYGANGVTPTAPIAGWTTGGTANVAYTITMTGATTICPADLSGGTAGVPDCAVDINDLLYFLSAFEAGNADVDNGSGTGALDCATDINDLLFFLTRFEAGC
jgi:subtilisin-like proprotein convertase family protein